MGSAVTTARSPSPRHIALGVSGELRNTAGSGRWLRFLLNQVTHAHLRH
jgi:hypothetical protein